MEFDMNKKHSGVVSIDKAQYKAELKRLKRECNICGAHLSKELGKAKTYLRNVNDTGRMSIEVLEKLDKRGVNIKLLAPCTVDEIKEFFDEINAYDIDTVSLAENVFEYYQKKNWHCKNGTIISRANVKYVLSSWYEREIKGRFGTEYKIDREKKKEPKKASKEVIKENDELLRKIDSLSAQLKKIEKKIDSMAKNDFKRDFDNINQKIDELTLKKLFFRK